jgi:hypothetical protein
MVRKEEVSGKSEASRKLMGGSRSTEQPDGPRTFLVSASCCLALCCARRWVSPSVLRAEACSVSACASSFCIRFHSFRTDECKDHPSIAVGAGPL